MSVSLSGFNVVQSWETSLIVSIRFRFRGSESVRIYAAARFRWRWCKTFFSFSLRYIHIKSLHVCQEEELTLPEKMAENSSDDKSETGQHAEVVQNGYPGYSGDDSYDNPMASTSDFSTEVRIDAPDAEENARAITFWGALRIPVGLCNFY